jgi:hypothetical protein
MKNDDVARADEQIAALDTVFMMVRRRSSLVGL